VEQSLAPAQEKAIEHWLFPTLRARVEEFRTAVREAA
jgi:hypothetical protein